MDTNFYDDQISEAQEAEDRLALAKRSDVRKFIPEPFDAVEIQKAQAQMHSMSILELMQPYQGEDPELHGKSKYEVMLRRVIDRCTLEKPDMRAVEFIQEHAVGKAVQRVENKTITMTYQDLIKKRQEAEAKFQAASQSLTGEAVDVQIMEGGEIDWSALV